MPLSSEEKKRILEAIEKDAEFRYALMGLLGFKEVLDRITRLEERFADLKERFQKLEERQTVLEERFAKLEERFAELEARFHKLEARYQRLEERFAKLEERFALLEERVVKLEERVAMLEERFVKLEERVARLEERVVRLEERFAELEERFAQLEERYQRLEERFARIEERVTGLEEAVKNLQLTLATVAHRFGVMSEGAFREAIKGIVEELFGAKAYRWIVYDDKGFVYGYPSQVEVDVVIRDGTHLLVEVKSRADTGDVLELVRIGEFYERREGVKPELAIVAGFVDPRAKRLAEKLGVKVYTYIGEG